MNRRTFIFIFALLLCLLVGIESRKTSRSRGSGSGRGSSRKTQSPQSVPPTSFSNPQPSAPKPSLFGWQEKPAQRTQYSSSKQSNPSNTQSHSYPSGNSQTNTNPLSNTPGHSYPSSNTKTHSYPSSNTGMSGNSNNQKSNMPVNKENAYTSNAQQNSPVQAGHSYPSSNGMSGNTGSYSQPGASNPSHGVGYPSHGAPPPPYPGLRPGDNNRQYAGGNYYHPQSPPMHPNYSPNNGGYGGYGPSPNMPGFFGNYANRNYGTGYGGVSRRSNILSGVGIAGAGIGTVLTGLALWNLARSTGHHHHTVIYDNRGQPVAVAPSNNTDTAAESILGDLVNCSLTISTDNATEVLAIPCAIATSFSPEADVKLPNDNQNSTDDTKCIISVLTKTGKEFMTTILCSILLKTAAENNVTEPPLEKNITESTLMDNNRNEALMSKNDTEIGIPPPSALLLTSGQSEIDNKTCLIEPGEVRDPINPCFAVTHNLTVIPLPNTSTTTSNISHTNEK